jgi:uncharacterized membrane protein (UPF0182 family)
MENLDTPQGQLNVEDKTVGIVAYITLIGFIISIVLNSNKQGDEKKFGAFHLRQALGLIICAIGIYIAFAIFSAIILAVSWKLFTVVSLLSLVIWFGFLALIIIGIINAANGTTKELPVIGALITKMLGKAFD